MSKKSEKKQKPLNQNPEFKTFHSLVKSSKRVLLSTHELPDGDGLGAEYALFHYLKRAKKSVRVYNPDPTPPRYQFLDQKKQVLLGPGEVELWDTFDLWIIVDTNDPRRLGPLWGELNLRAKKIVFLDHHISLGNDDPKVSYPPNCLLVSDTESSSIGELLRHFFDELKLAEINRDIAHGLYVSVMTDTNSFRYARTTPEAHIIAAETIMQGVNPEWVYQSIYSSKEVSHLRLLGNMLQNVKISAGGKLAWLEMDLDLRKKHRATADDTQSFLNLLLLLKDAEVVCFFREEDDSKVRVSIKSKGRIKVNRVAVELGGGGHEYAAGLALAQPLRKTVAGVTKRIEELIDSFERFGK